MFIYKYTYEAHSEELVKYEMKSIFGLKKINGDFIISSSDIRPNKSYFINYRIDALYKADSVDELLPQIAASELYYEGFKIEFIDVKSDVMEYKTRIGYCITIADLIGGYGQMKNPSITFVITCVQGIWYFGKLERNDRAFERLQIKPHTYSHSMSCELSRTVVNIACSQDRPKLIDPCLGIGTVIAEAIDLGYEIEGTELNWLVFDKARNNLTALGMEANIKRMDMHDITKQYDVSILDIPYGLMSKTTVELQTGLIAKCYDISNKLVLVSNEDCDQMLLATNWMIEDKINVPKANYNFERFIYVLSKGWATR